MRRTASRHRASGLLLVAVVALLGGCSAPVLKRQVLVDVVDFRPYERRGFLFTPDRYGGDYDAMGLVSVVIKPAVNTKELMEAYQGPRAVGQAIYESVSPGEALDRMFEAATSLGADGVMNLVMRPVQYLPTQGVSALEVSGMAIRRKGAFQPLDKALPSPE